MNGKFKIILTGLVVALLASCASTPQQHFASSIQAAQAANRPLVVYQFKAGNSFNRAAHPRGNINTYAGVAFINASGQPIRKLVFRLADYRGDQPILGADGRPVENELVADGPFAPGSSHAIVSTIPLWLAQLPGPFGCPRLTGIEVVYPDGATLSVPADKLSQYAVSWLNVHCAFANTNSGHAHSPPGPPGWPPNGFPVMPSLFSLPYVTGSGRTPLPGGTR